MTYFIAFKEGFDRGDKDDFLHDICNSLLEDNIDNITM